MYLDGLLPAGAIVGLFADTALYKDMDKSKESNRDRDRDRDSADHDDNYSNNKGELQRVHTAGLSLRLAGFRIDVGAPIHRHMLSRAPKVALGIDFGD